MGFFPYAHATHPHWEMAVALVLAQLRAQLAQTTTVAPTLALLYVTDHYAAVAEEILQLLQTELPQVSDWSGTVGVGIVANNVEYWDEPALAVMLLHVPRTQYQVFSTLAALPPDFEAHTALVHADASSPDIEQLIDAVAQRTGTRYLFGGVSSSRASNLQFAAAAGHAGAAAGVVRGGLSGVAFGPDVALLSEVTQGCTPVSRVHTITEAEHNVVLCLDHEPGLDMMVADLGLALDQPYEALRVVRATRVGLLRSEHPPGPDTTVRPTGNFGDDVVVRHIIGIDLGRGGIVVSDRVDAGSELVFCRRDVQAARADLTRICAEIREELESPEPSIAQVRPQRRVAEPPPRPAVERIAGAVYISCTGRGGPYFGSPSAELQIIRRTLGDVPLVGFFAAGEIARNHIYGYSGVLTVFLAA